ncbi:MAG: tyrosine--tRNA ligase [Candidatus Pacebacteria bacterium]|nr:tyrosine--tRNA ligase [Candidatus Paceibacterota bacterium]
MAIKSKKTIVDEEKIEEILSKTVEDVIDKNTLKKDLESGIQMRIKFGIDPTGPKIHLGRAVPLRKLREFQKLGHHIVLIIGDFTAQIGDASDKGDKRPMLTRAEIDENLKDYKSQIGKILDLTKIEFVYNNDWLAKLTFGELVKLSECFTVQQMLARRNFKERFETQKEISLREFLYPIMQGYDSVFLKADVEIGGFDQLFNLKAGRIMQDYYGMKKQHIMTCEMLEGTNGEKMSTSQGNVINIVDEPNDMFGKIMSMKDSLIIKYMRLCTDATKEEIKDAEKFLSNKENNPRDLKIGIAKNIVAIYHGEQDASKAENNFIKTFQKGGISDDIEKISINDLSEEETLGDFFVSKKIVASKSEWKRLIDTKSIKELIENNGSFEEKNILDFREKVYKGIFKIGKKRFVRLVL